MHISTLKRAGMVIVALVALAACGDDHADGAHSHDTTIPSTSPSIATGAAAPSTTAGSAPTTGATGVAAAPTTTAVAAAASGPIIEVSYKAGKVEGGGRKPVTKGQNVTLRVTADVVDEVHLHGYDKKVNTIANQTVELVFKADASGIFEVELEKKGLKLVELEVK